MIQKEAWSFYRTIAGVRLCWELEEAKGPKGRAKVRFVFGLNRDRTELGTVLEFDESKDQSEKMSMRAENAFTALRAEVTPGRKKRRTNVFQLASKDIRLRNKSGLQNVELNQLRTQSSGLVCEP